MFYYWINDKITINENEYNYEDYIYSLNIIYIYSNLHEYNIGTHIYNIHGIPWWQGVF